MGQYKPGEQHDQLVSKSWGKYDDMRMPWTGRAALGPDRYIAIPDTSTLVAASNEDRVWISLQNVGANDVYLNFGEAADAAYPSMVLYANGGSLFLDRNSPWPFTIYAVCGAGLASALCVNDVCQLTSNGRGE